MPDCIHAGSEYLQARYIPENMLKESSASRSPGLDMARALAIAAVLAAHSGLFFARFWRDMNGFSFWSGVFGVELFFVLSGLLIGKILFRDVLPHCSFRKMGIFFLRRWMRTLPAYYAVLALLVIYAFAAQAPLPHIWRYAAFLQNCPPEYAAFFPVSWSLSVEQWAYIAIPPLLLTAAHLPFSASREWRMLWGIVAAVAFCAMMRLYAAADAPALWDEDFRKQVPFRLDAVLFGVGAAWLRQYRPGIHARLGHVFVFAASVSLLWIFARHYSGAVFQPEGNVFLKSFGFSVIDMSLALSLCFLDCSAELRHALDPAALPGKLALLGSRYAYSVYLVHWTPFIFFSQQAEKSSLPGVMAFYIGALAVTFITAYMLYRMIEEPCMRIRPKFSSTDI